MPLSMHSEITAMDIKSGAALDDKWSVYKLVGWFDEELVLKVETNSGLRAQDFKMAKRVMKLVDRPGAEAKLLNAHELYGLKGFLKQTALMAAAASEHRVAAYANSNGVPEWVTEMTKRIDGLLWYKMPMRQLADLGQALRHHVVDPQRDGLLATFETTLCGPDGMESLGRIVACDLINGNTDRFYPGRGVAVPCGNVAFQCRVLVNIGNVFIAGTGASRSLSGMDFIDPSAIYRSYDRTIKQINGSSKDGSWSGDYLTDRKLRRKFCEDVVWDLNLVLCGGIANGKSRLLRLAVESRRSAEERLELGMIVGAHQVREGLRERFAKDKERPAGLDSRLRALDALPKPESLGKLGRFGVDTAA